MNKLFAVLLCAHVWGDFLFQPAWMARNKHRLPVLLLHSAIHGLLAYLFVGRWTLWQLPVVAGLVHGLVDFVKVRAPEGDTARVFAADQAAHVAFLGALAFLLHRAGIVPVIGGLYRPLVWISGFLVTVFGAGAVVERTAARLFEENEGLEAQLNGLKNGGRLIGRLERALIFLFMAIGYPAGIGFLVTAKSILRFGEARERAVAEYVLIGTLMSFSLALAASAATFVAAKW